MEMQNNSSLPWTEVLSIVSSLVSLIVAGFAIWLSVVFYRLSNDSSIKIKESAEKIGATVDRLEALFDKLYSDTFSIMKDTVSDMRKHIWRDDSGTKGQIATETELRADEKIQELQQQFQHEVTRILSQQSSTDERLTILGDEMKSLVGRAINESRRAEVAAREETLREHILSIIKGMPKASIRLSVLRNLLKQYPEADVVEELFKLAREGVVGWPGAPKSLGADQEIGLTRA